MDKRTTINQLVIEEYQKANEKFPMFASSHEAHAVNAEEIEEFKEEVDKIISLANKNWYYVKTNDLQSQEDVLTIQIEHCFRACEELIQVMAMIHKFKMYLAGIEKDKTPF